MDFSLSGSWERQIEHSEPDHPRYLLVDPDLQRQDTRLEGLLRAGKPIPSVPLVHRRDWTVTDQLHQ